MKEIWKNIKGYEGLYQVSNLGNVKSLVRKGVKKERILKPGKTGRDRNTLSVALCLNGVYKTFKIHQLVAVSFLNHKPNKYTLVVDHIDNNPLNNNVNNLQLITNRENCSKDKNQNGLPVGVYYDRRYNNFLSRIRIGKDKVHLGCFNTKEKASEYYLKALENINIYKGDPLLFRKFIQSITF